MAMAVGICTLRLSMPLNQDLKAKRRVLQSVIAHLRAAFNVSVAEVGEHDKWQVATLGIAAISTDSGYLHGLLTKAVRMVEDMRLDATVLDYEIEIL
jgi:uncharacterized protein YlxP (DUF503 family)